MAARMLHIVVNIWRLVGPAGGVNTALAWCCADGLLSQQVGKGLTCTTLVAELRDSIMNWTCDCREGSECNKKRESAKLQYRYRMPSIMRMRRGKPK